MKQKTPANILDRDKLHIRIKGDKIKCVAHGECYRTPSGIIYPGDVFTIERATGIFSLVAIEVLDDGVNAYLTNKVISISTDDLT